MSGSKTTADAEAVRSWYTELLDQVVKEMIRLKAVTGVAVQATPVWAVPQDMLMAKVWGVGKENDFVWTLSVDKFIADFIAGSLAASPRDAARHFSLKWQMDADRILGVEKSNTAGKKDRKRLRQYSNRLIRYAETLYDLSNRDEPWQQQLSQDG